MLKDGFKGLFNNQDAEKMPVLSIGHGSPMNAIEENTHALNALTGIGEHE
jgi:aromatic ring-opening dioxygenase catalytic subunit (LigB family)